MRKPGAILLALLLGSAPAAFADGLTKQQADELLKQNREVLNELRQIHQLLERQGTAQQAAVPAPQASEKVSMQFASGGFSLGRADAPVTLVEYTDYQCPFCRQFHITAFEEIKKNYIDTGKVRYVSRDFPLDMHENAPRAALAARCAAEQGKFWELRHVMIVNANQLQMQNLQTYAADLKMDVGAFSTCVASDKYQAEIQKDMAEGRVAGVSGTPSFVLGTTKGGEIDGVRIVGALPYATFDARLQSLLAQAPAK